jgi:hypothetical protein
LIENPQRYLTDLVIGNFAYKAVGINEEDGGVLSNLQFRKLQEYTRITTGE